MASVAWLNQQRRLGDLKNWPKNPRKLSDRDARELERSLRRFGYADPIIINADNEIIGGHQRRIVSLSAGLMSADEVVDVRVPDRLLSPRECEELAIRLNRNQGSWDWDLLANNFDERDLFDWGFDPKDFSFYEDKNGDQSAGRADGASVVRFIVTVPVGSRDMVYPSLNELENFEGVSVKEMKKEKTK